MEGRGGLINPPGTLQDLRQRLCVAAKAATLWEWWSRRWHATAFGLTRERVCPGLVTTESGSHPSGLITRDVNGAGARSAVNLHAACDVAEAGNGLRCG
jgi:hypothetical protein